MNPVLASLLVVTAAAVVAPRVLGRRGPIATLTDAPWLLLGGLVMLTSAAVQVMPASAWSPTVDLGSFAVGTSLLVTSPPASWPRHVGALILGIHAAQVLVTNPGAPLSGGMA